jgi:hypothetical protein
MSTYKSEFKAQIQWVDLADNRMVVVYSDPHGYEDITQTIKFYKTDTIEKIKESIINTTPHQRFHFRAEAEKNNDGDNSLEILKLLNTEMTYKLPSFDNEDI